MAFSWFRPTIRIVLTGGGTGGHIFPLIAVAEKLFSLSEQKGINLELTYIGPTTGPFSFDPNLLEERGIKVIDIAGQSPDNANNPLEKIFIYLKEIFGMLESLFFMWWIMPDVVFSKGGYGAFPVIISGFLYQIPILIHESDAIPGKVNEISQRFARRVAVSFEKAAGYFQENKTALIGNPTRDIFFNEGNREHSLRYFGFDEKIKTIFVYGGSQGSKRINELVLASLPKLLEDYQVIHQCGSRNYQDVVRDAEFILKKAPEDKKKRYILYGFMKEEEVKNAYVVSDLIVSRAGSGQIAEIAAMGKPSIIIPLSTAARNHQRENAYAFAKNGACLVLEEENLKANLFFEEVSLTLKNQTKLEAMAKAAKAFAKPEAGQLIAKEILVISGIRN